MYGAPRPLKELLRRIRPVGMAMPGAAGLAGDPAQRHAAAQVEGHAVEVGIRARARECRPRASCEPLKPNLVSLMTVGDSNWLRLATAFCGTMVVLYRLSVEFWVCEDYALIAEIARVEAVLRAEVVVEADAARVFTHAGRSGNVDDIEQRVGRSGAARQERRRAGAGCRCDAVGGGTATQSGRARTAALSVLSTIGDAVCWRRPSKLAKKNALSF